MKQIIKRILASLMVVVMIFIAEPLSGLVGMELNLDWLAFTPKASAAQYVFPVTGGHSISQYFSSSHGAIDVANCAQQPVVATATGTVIRVDNNCQHTNYSKAGCTAEHNKTCGNCVYIKHDGTGYVSVYGHLYPNSICVSVGQKVQAGQQLGLVGSSGMSTGYHLHFEIRPYADNYINWERDSENINVNPSACSYIYLESPYENYTSPPSSLSVKINKYVLNIDESFTITCFANDADHYWIGFYLDNVLIKDTATNSGVATVTLAKQGKYSVVVSAINSQGEINAYSSVVVGDASDYIPETPDVILSSYVLDVGEQLTISFSSNKVEEYWLGIYKNGVLIKSLTPTNNEYITSFDEVGKYSVTVTAINKFGETYKNIWFTIGKYDIIYDANDCSNVPSAQTKAYGTDLILSTTRPIKQNYNFIEWNTKPDGTGVSYQPGDIYSENADLTLYAIWELDHEHQYISEITQQPTCTEKGIKVFTCSLCDDVYYEDVDELGHNYIGRVTEPTCTSQGFATYECSRCDDSYIESYIDPLNHSSSSWHTAINPTATSEGLAEKRCDYCGIVLDQFTIPCLTPDYVTGITLSSKKETVEIGDTFTLSATVVPDTAKNKNIIWSSRNPEIVSVSNGKVTAIKPGTTAIVAETEDGGYIDFCLVRVISLVALNGAVIDNDRNIIYGLSSNLESVDDYLKTADDSMTVTLSTSTVGTGTFINVMDNGEVVDLYEAVVFGDVNGDSWYDGQDAVLVSCLANGMLTKDDVSDAVYMAADCNHDGVIDELDVALLNKAGTLLLNVDQSKPTEVLLETSAEYVEYLDLIDQSFEFEVDEETEGIPEEDIEETPETNTDVESENTTPEQGNVEVNIFEMIINFIKSIFELLFTYISVPIK